MRRKYPLNSTSLANAGLGIGLGGGGAGTTLGGVRLEPGRRKGLLATPAQQIEVNSKIKKAPVNNLYTCSTFQNSSERARNNK